MTSDEIKLKIKNRLDEISNVKLLKEIDAITDYLVSDKDDWDNLPPKLKEAIEEGIMQLDNNNKITYDEVKRINNKWFTK